MLLKHVLCGHFMSILMFIYRLIIILSKYNICTNLCFVLFLIRKRNAGLDNEKEILFRAISLVEVNLNGANGHDTRADRGPAHVSVSLSE